MEEKNARRDNLATKQKVGDRPFNDLGSRLGPWRTRLPRRDRTSLNGGTGTFRLAPRWADASCVYFFHLVSSRPFRESLDKGEDKG